MKKIRIMFALMFCLTIVVPMAIAASSYCPAHDSGTHFYVNWPDYKRLRVKQKNDTYHILEYEIWQSCECGASRRHPSFPKTSEKDEFHSHTQEVPGTRVNTGGKKIDNQYHYAVYSVDLKCACGHTAYKQGIIDRSKKIKHKYTRTISDITKPSGVRTVVKECVCGARQTKTYNPDKPTQ